VNGGDLGRSHDFFFRRFLVGHQNVFADGFAEKERILQDRHDVAAEVGFLDVFEFDPVDFDGAAGVIIKTGKQ